MKKKSNKKYDNPCFGHKCEEYKYAEDLSRKIHEIYQEWNSVEKRAFPLIQFLRKLGILPSTLEHGKTCRPINLKLMEGVKLFCEETGFDFISDDKKSVLEYVKMNKPKQEVTEDTKQGNKLDLGILINEEDK